VEDDCRSARSVVQGHLKWAVGCLIEHILIACDKNGLALKNISMGIKRDWDK